MKLRRTLTSVSIAGLLVAGCANAGNGTAARSAAPVAASTSTATAPAVATVARSGCVVGVSWAEHAGRWADRDEPGIKAAVSRAGATYLSTDAARSADTQAADVESLIAQGATVLIVVAEDGTAIQGVVASALGRGVPVIAYDRLIDNPAALYISFDNVEVGRMQARALIAVAPKGNYLFIKGDAADANSDLLRSGQAEVLSASIASGDIVNGGETYTRDWDPDLARTATLAFLGATSNHVGGVLAQNDGMAGGVIAALASVQLAGMAAVSGQDADAESLRAVAFGTQTVDVWKDTRALGAAAGDAAVELCAGRTTDRVDGTTPFTTPSGNVVHAIFIPPVAITRANLDVVVEADWISAAELCAGVAPGSVAACP
jgi:D-xylose transport system substrate-binding protein